MSTIWKWIRTRYFMIVNSIAFIPVLISFLFLLISAGMLWFDFSDTGKQIKTNIGLITLQDANTARTVVASIAAGIISLTVFSFSMVMIVLNQAASQMSNRILDVMIGNRFQQTVLGIFIGTIVYALFLLSTIRDIQSGIYIPAMSIYLLVLLMVTDIFLFIYFLHWVTQTVKYETIISRIHQQTIKALDKQHHSKDLLKPRDNLVPVTTVQAIETGYFQGYNKTQLLEFVQEKRIVIEFLYACGAYLVKGADMLRIHGGQLSKQEVEHIYTAIDFFSGQSIAKNPYFGFQQLSEVAVKALSPGINDGATAVSAINALADLFAYYIHNPTCAFICDTEKTVWIIVKEKSFEDLFKEYLGPIWHYGKKDPFVQRSLWNAVVQLKQIDTGQKHWAVLNKTLLALEKEQQVNDAEM